MNNRQIAHIFAIMAAIMAITGENKFRARAYERAAENIARLPQELSTLYEADRLEGLPGIGQTLREKIISLLKTGTLPAYEELLASVPRGLVRMLELPTVGPKTVQLLHEQLGIESIEQLEVAARRHKIRILPGMGAKKEANILQAIATYRDRPNRMLLSTARSIATEVREQLRAKAGPDIEHIAVAGSVRRGRETVGDIDILVTSSSPSAVFDAFVSLPMNQQLLLRGETKCSVITVEGCQIDLRVVESRSFGAALQYFTGSKVHNVRLRERAVHQNLKVNEYGVFDSTDRYLAGETEAQMYEALGLRFIPPELREDRGELAAAEAGRLPALVEEKDLRGDLHLHTIDSDGMDTVEVMATAAYEKGYEYIAITDHSVSLHVANGLDSARLEKQMEHIHRFNQEGAPLRVLTGSEVNINPDGSLDLPDEVLRKLDIVIASVHSSLRQDKKTMTERVLRALANPWVNILAHPTGRLLGQREGIDIDLDTVLEAAKSHRVALEINSQPERLDLSDGWVYAANRRGVALVVSSDAHRALSLDTVSLGVLTARRGWLQKDTLLNAWPLEKLLAFFHGG